MKFKDQLDKYVRESEHRFIVDQIIEKAKDGGRQLIVCSEDISWCDITYLREKGLLVEHYNSEEKIEISW